MAAPPLKEVVVHRTETPKDYVSVDVASPPRKRARVALDNKADTPTDKMPTSSPPVGTPPGFTTRDTSPEEMAKVGSFSLGASASRVGKEVPRSIKGRTGDLKARFGGRHTRKVRIPMKHTGDLVNLGYSMTKKARSRHGALKKAVKKFGRATVSRKLNALAVFNKRRHPATARKARADRKYAMKV